jgi:hypothetical protein
MTLKGSTHDATDTRYIISERTTTTQSISMFPNMRESYMGRDQQKQFDTYFGRRQLERIDELKHITMESPLRDLKQDKGGNNWQTKGQDNSSVTWYWYLTVSRGCSR